jgi:gallate decarboxylase subunit D
METITKVRLSVGTPPFVIEAFALHCGKDWSVTIGGGERFHIGACAVAFVQPSLKDPERYSGTVSVIAVPGHKEDELARSAALRIANALQTTVIVNVGIHINRATREDIQKMVSLFEEMVAKLIGAMAT